MRLSLEHPVRACRVGRALASSWASMPAKLRATLACMASVTPAWVGWAMRPGGRDVRSQGAKMVGGAKPRGAAHGRVAVKVRTSTSSGNDRTTLPSPAPLHESRRSPRGRRSQ